MTREYIPILEFERNCDLNLIRYEVAKDKDGRKHISLTTSSRDMRNVRDCLLIVLEQKPELEKQLIQKLELKAANLAVR